MSSLIAPSIIPLDEIKSAAKKMKIDAAKAMAFTQVEARSRLIGEVNAEMKNKFSELRRSRAPRHASILDVQTISDVTFKLTRKFDQEMERELLVGSLKDKFLKEIFDLIVKMEELINGRKKMIAELDAGLKKIRIITGGL